ncbi:MAG TPA: FliM/FliN family flagellar motor switch protein [Conexibacter sp.]|nr:FliM/FliN family flagellar motor switch protein [Conexibacter sp.]
MSPADVASTTGALMRLGASTAEAVAKSLDAICPSPVERGDVTVVPGEESPFEGFPFDDGPVVAVSVHYVDGVTGGNVLLMTAPGARAIAAAMGGDAVAAPPLPDAPADAPLADSSPADASADAGPASAPSADPPTELELSAVAEAANQMFAAAASATGVVLSQGVEIAPPDTRLLDSAATAREAFDVTPHAVSATFVVCGEPCRLVQLVPNAFVLRMTRALDEQGTEQLSGDGGLSALGIARRTEPGEERALDDALRDIRVRVWAELGRTRVSLGAAPALPPGAVLELDRKADDPVDLYVNGLRFASGRLVLTDEGEWALRLEEVAGRTEPVLAAVTTEEEI